MRSGSKLKPLARAVLRTQPDERLVALAREGREAAFEEIVRRYRPGLVAFAAAYAPADRAEDVVQEGLVSSWDALRRTEREIHLKPWLYTIVRNRALNARRDARPHEPLPDDLDGVRGPEAVALDNEELARVVGAVGALPQAQREALVRSAIEGHTHEQIAASIGATTGAVRQLIYRARLAVRHGVGAVIPLPLVRALAEVDPGAVATAAAGGGAAAASATGGASMLSKAAVVAVAGTIAAGSGVALKRAADERSRAESPSGAAVERGGERGSGSGDGSGAAPATGDPSAGASTGPGAGGEREAEDRSGEDSGRERETRDSSGPGSDDAPEAGDDSSGPSSSSGPGSSGSDDHDNSGPGSESSGSGSSGSGSSGSGSSGSGSDDLLPDDSSGSSGSGSSGSDSSGSGSDDSGSSGSGSADPPD